MKTFTVLATITFLAIACEATAQQPAPPPTTPTSVVAATPAPVVVKKTNDQDRVICHTEEVIGSRLGGHKTCMTKAQWDVVAASSRDAMTHAQSSAGFLVPPSH